MQDSGSCTGRGISWLHPCGKHYAIPWFSVILIMPVPRGIAVCPNSFKKGCKLLKIK